jgi:F-box and leucine-rich repeat protein GRR1
MLTDTALDCVAKLGDHLDVLIIAHVSNVTDRGVVKIARECINLRIVDVACRLFSRFLKNNSAD